MPKTLDLAVFVVMTTMTDVTNYFTPAVCARGVREIMGSYLGIPSLFHYTDILDHIHIMDSLHKLHLHHKLVAYCL